MQGTKILMSQAFVSNYSIPLWVNNDINDIHMTPCMIK